ncbi:hypothetical protein NXX77_26750 [Phocaeicola dorei]|nr:hypothetical protein [Phocaeicola dorei]
MPNVLGCNKLFGWLDWEERWLVWSVSNEYTQQIIDSTATLIRAAEAEIKRLTNETENTDS